MWEVFQMFKKRNKVNNPWCKFYFKGSVREK